MKGTRSNLEISGVSLVQTRSVANHTWAHFSQQPEIGFFGARIFVKPSTIRL
jgi:hypothetical protein